MLNIVMLNVGAQHNRLHKNAWDNDTQHNAAIFNCYVTLHFCFCSVIMLSVVLLSVVAQGQLKPT
jgi:hypothetical protein